MITIDKVTYRNLQEQVQKNKEDIAAWQNVGFTLNSFGIKVLGKLDSESDIPTGTYEYGDAYLVGLTDPYNLYIYTRTNEAADSGSFVNVGPLNVIGQEGPEGPQGPKGDDGYAPVVRYGNGLPVTESTDKDGYLYIDQQTSRLYTFNDNKWNYVVNMQGAKGDQGIQGIQGATGTTLSIVARLASPDLLPTNFASGAIPKNSAYLVDVQGANHLYIILGNQSDYSTWYWADAGDFNLGSVLYKDSVFQQYANITDLYNTNTGAVVTDTATSKLASDITSELNTKVSIDTFNNEILNKADVDNVVTPSELSDTINSTKEELNNNINNVNDNLTGLINGKQDKLNASQLSAVNSGITQSLVSTFNQKADMPSLSQLTEWNENNLSASLYNCAGTIVKSGFNIGRKGDVMSITGGFIIYVESRSADNPGIKINLPSSWNIPLTISVSNGDAFVLDNSPYDNITPVGIRPYFIRLDSDTRTLSIRLTETYTNVLTGRFYAFQIPLTYIKLQ